jgi:hypothetical protein
MAKTQIFEDYAAFLARADKTINGVTADFVSTFGIDPTKDEGNVGCWNVVRCRDCVDCRNCKACVNCEDCTECVNCEDCMGCSKCMECVRCINCVRCQEGNEVSNYLNNQER